MKMETRHDSEGFKSRPSADTDAILNNTGKHFYLEICVRLDHFIDISKGLWRSED
ncbi:hypothetical protein E2C01_081081 [Portunus trituberculatus]|uniref:Uncharacterized protein n=1 Tax=Portunus trituberculatus TaxID=210409 RepID=A0A5B7J045_PORTR|nr:hypothetical protein [Portunus trituberculatus]